MTDNPTTPTVSRPARANDAPAAASDAPQALTLDKTNAHMAVSPSANSAAIIQAYQGNLTGQAAHIETIFEQLEVTFAKVKNGDLHGLEAMLISQATALQTIFTSLTLRAQSQQGMKTMESFLGLALKAQAQSRATISALVDLKYPRQATFVKQANITQGPQQVNNCPSTSHEREEFPISPNKLSREKHELLENTGTQSAPVTGHSTMETLGKVRRTKIARG